MNKKRKPPYLDLAAAGVKEDDRIRMIGEAGLSASQNGVGCVTDNEPEKIARYKRKFAERYPALEIFSEGPIADGCYAMMLRPKTDPTKAN